MIMLGLTGAVKALYTVQPEASMHSNVLLPKKAAPDTAGDTDWNQRMWGQCGGKNYNGSTKCVPQWYADGSFGPSVCTYQNEYYSQCMQPGTGIKASIVSSSASLVRSSQNTAYINSSNYDPLNPACVNEYNGSYFEAGSCSSEFLDSRFDGGMKNGHGTRSCE